MFTEFCTGLCRLLTHPNGDGGHKLGGGDGGRDKTGCESADEKGAAGEGNSGADEGVATLQARSLKCDE